MARPKGSKNKSVNVIDDHVHMENNDGENGNISETPPQKPVKDEYISMFQAAERMKTDETTIKLWVDHGHLRADNGRVSVRSIKECRLTSRRMR